ncbi:hypothetical protein D3C81_2064870 [compost metagenome]
MLAVQGVAVHRHLREGRVPLDQGFHGKDDGIEIFIFGYKCAYTGIQAAADVKLGGLSGQYHNSGHLFELLQALDDFHAVEARKPDIQDHDVGS